MRLRRIFYQQLAIFGGLSTYKGARVSHLTCDRGCSRREWAGKQGTAAFALAAFKIAVIRADGILAWLDLVAVHGNAHAAAWLAPLGSSLFKNLSLIHISEPTRLGMIS